MEAIFFGRPIFEQQNFFVKEQEEEFAKLKTDKGVEAFEKLRLLDLKQSSLKVVEYYVQLCSKELTWLCLDGTMIRFQSLETLGSFTGLRILEMKGCCELIELPPSIGNLSLLTVLQLSFCKALKTLPDTISNLSLLTKLKLRFCEALKTLPDTISKLEKLQILQLRNCYSLEGLPTSIGGLTSLKKLNCRYCKSLAQVPTQVGQLRKLEFLSFEGCSQLKTLCIFEAKMDHLCELNLESCDGLSTLELLGNLHRLKTLKIESSNLWIDNLPDQLKQLSQLQLLNLSDYEKLNEGILETICKGQLCPNHLENLELSFFLDCELPPCLKSLRLTNGNQVEKLPESICNLLHLEKLYLYEHVSTLKVLPDALCKLETLKLLELDHFEFLERLPTYLGYLSSLQQLRIFYCTKLVELPSSICNLS
jgi:Leucine-rich repeat (LRR) protein